MIEARKRVTGATVSASAQEMTLMETAIEPSVPASGAEAKVSRIAKVGAP
jgi:hypothetical protein